MKISSINVVLTEEDIMDFINEYLKNEEFNIDNISFDKGIKVKAWIKKGIKIHFLLYVNIDKVENNKLHIDIKKIKVFGLPISKFVIDKILERISDENIVIENKNIILDVALILKQAKGIKVDVDSILMNNGQLMVGVKNLMLDMKEIGQAVPKIESELEEPKTINEVKKVVEEAASEESKNEKIDKELPLVVEQSKQRKEDIYTKGRNVIIENMPDKLKPYSEYILIIPDLTALVGRLLMEDRVSTKTKIIVSAMLGYVIVPGDIINDKVPFIGSIDDLGMVFFAINRIVNDVPLKVILENWDGEDEIVLIFRKTVEYLSKYTTAAKIEKLYSVIESLT